MRALLIIDVQNDFLPGGALAVPGGDDIITLINSIQARFDLIVATQDWHPAGHKSFASSHNDKKPFDVIPWMGHEQVLWPDHCIQGTEGAACAPGLDMNRVAAIFRKGMSPEIDSYSGFYDNGHLRSTGLAHYLKGMQVAEVFIAGLAGDFCVFFTAKDARLEGFQTRIIEDATRSISNRGFENAKKEMHQQGAHIISSHQLDW